MKNTLKSLSISIKEFGLGFIQIKLNDSKSINIYTNKVNKFDNYLSPHNHQRDFESIIIKGQLREQLYDVVVDDNGQTAFCGCGNVDNPIDEKYDYTTSHQMLYEKGDSYKRDKSTFHSVEADEGTITLITKNLSSVHDAIVLGEKSEPYKSNFSEDELWNIVFDIVDNDDIIFLINKLKEL